MLCCNVTSHMGIVGPLLLEDSSNLFDNPHKRRDEQSNKSESNSFRRYYTKYEHIDLKLSYSKMHFVEDCCLL